MTRVPVINVDDPNDIVDVKLIGDGVVVVLTVDSCWSFNVGQLLTILGSD